MVGILTLSLHTGQGPLYIDVVFTPDRLARERDLHMGICLLLVIKHRLLNIVALRLCRQVHPRTQDAGERHLPAEGEQDGKTCTTSFINAILAGTSLAQVSQELKACCQGVCVQCRGKSCRKGML